jgi:hypothetical protein
VTENRGRQMPLNQFDHVNDLDDRREFVNELLRRRRRLRLKVVVFFAGTAAWLAFTLGAFAS